jgi:multiple sugar transport system permease protein
MWRTVLYTAITLPLGTAGALGLALLLNARLPARGTFRTIYYVPAVIPPVAAVTMFEALFSRDNGLINAVLQGVGLPAVGWLDDPTVFTTLVIMVLWGLGGGMVIFLAGLQGVPHELREAAAIDGANRWQEFRAVTLPLLSPVLFYMLVTGFINSLQTLTQPLLLATTGQIGELNVPRSDLLYMVNVYFQLFYNQRLAYASALLWVLFAVVLLVTVLVFRFGTQFIYYEVAQDRRE